MSDRICFDFKSLGPIGRLYAIVISLILIIIFGVFLSHLCFPETPSLAIALPSFLITSLALIRQVCLTLQSEDKNAAMEKSDVKVFLKDQTGKPCKKVVIFNHQGCSRNPDKRGICRIPKSWIGEVVSIRDSKTWQEISRERIKQDPDGMMTITVQL